MDERDDDDDDELDDEEGDCNSAGSEDELSEGELEEL
jgi:hypothetical protein